MLDNFLKWCMLLIFKALPLVMKYLSLNDTLPLRQVHPQWKKIVDSTFQRLSAHPQENFEAELELKGLESKELICRVSQRFPTDLFPTASLLVPKETPFYMDVQGLGLPLTFEIASFALYSLDLELTFPISVATSLFPTLEKWLKHCHKF